jgi:hypothetical protein
VVLANDSPLVRRRAARRCAWSTPVTPFALAARRYAAAAANGAPGSARHQGNDAARHLPPSVHAGATTLERGTASHPAQYAGVRVYGSAPPRANIVKLFP